MRNRTRLLVAGTLLASTVGCDQATKAAAEHVLRDGPPLHYLGGLLTLTYARNPGAYLSLGDSLGTTGRFLVFTVGVGVFLLALVWHLFRSRELSRLEASGVSLLLGGGVGNLIDRVFRDGLVIDFLHVGTRNLGTGIFNVADIAIHAGIGLLLISLWERRRVPAITETPPPD
jgi:signal peptidase II